ncbi:nucleotide sugar dehydrogenase [Paractinoplanes rishiriensis]|uniref:UDP-N-acetyl-D-glucosamine dehydrogenase n=1 Tax=Paractinoplanes rishiriensis TaxID=1050105 RepID=A0A919N2E3_9ACTN|nr:nucleotide sugar dehydrogenase [Actinoplanes rishiriensis]GIE99682.1 UDP-N-acetyl-D-glucosamine dehydrogenase [Actinoplanes rishiriensis]
MTAPPQRRIAIIGQGYVGLPVAHAAVRAGHTVVGFDTDPDKIARLGAGSSPIDDVADPDLDHMLATGRYRPTGDHARLNDCDAYVVTVPTPLRDNRPDLTAVLSAARLIAPHVRDDTLVVLESTVAPGTTAGAFRTEIDRYATWTPRYLLAFSPERIDPGNPQWGFRNTPKLVAGADLAARDAAVSLYRTICDTVVPCPTLETAELAKLLENTYRYVNIALVNEFGRHAHALGASIWDVVTAAATKPYGFQPFWPGPGVGGHCLPVDPFYLEDGVEQRLGRGFDFIHAAGQINNGQPDYVVQRAVRLLNDRRRPVNGSTVLVLGYSYKVGTADIRETPAAKIVRLLLDLGAQVTVSDPHLAGAVPGIPAAKVIDHRDAARAATDADLVLLTTAHPEFDYDALAEAASTVLDTRNRFRPRHTVHQL